MKTPSRTEFPPDDYRHVTVRQLEGAESSGPDAVCRRREAKNVTYSSSRPRPPPETPQLVPDDAEDREYAAQVAEHEVVPPVNRLGITRARARCLSGADAEKRADCLSP